eukprot:gb/GECH01013533.1/.p1 GENE.gb/GECH01013533.1/~~gb/GECH01013533.1/.p1  ORF type:complete len:365 (+),score=74.76 gb/GECH01013533.1/:1-1095(+)
MSFTSSFLSITFIVTLSICLALLLPVLPPLHPDGSATPLRDLYPSSRDIQLSNDVTVQMPFFSDRSSSVIVYSLVDEERLKNVGPRIGLFGGKAGAGDRYEPALVKDKESGVNKAVVMLWLMNYEKSTCGPYDEVVSTVLVRPKNHGGDSSPYPCATRSMCPAHVFLNDPSVLIKSGRTWVTTETAKLVGRKWMAIDKTIPQCERQRSDDGSVFDITWRDTDKQSTRKAHFRLETSKTWIETMWKNGVDIVREFGIRRVIGLLVRLNILDDPLPAALVGTGAVHDHPVFHKGMDDPVFTSSIRMSLFDVYLEAFDPQRHTVILDAPKNNHGGADGLEQLNLEPVAFQRVDQIQMAMTPSYNYME